MNIEAAKRRVLRPLQRWGRVLHLAALFPGLAKAWRNLSASWGVIEELSPPGRYQPLQADILQTKQTLEQLLTENLLPFWYPQVLDREDGGYRLNHDRHGQWQGRANKYLVSQARTVWFFSRLAQSPYGGSEHVEAAQHGYEFLYNQMWDKNFGGFHEEVDSSGRTVVKPDKHLYGQAFGLYALSEYTRASGDSSARILSQELFHLLEIHAHDSQYGGYQESFQRDWQPGPANRPHSWPPAPILKRMNTHLHLLEAITTFYAINKDPLVGERLSELILVQSNAVVRKTLGACTDKYRYDWLPLQGPNHDRVSYGHDLENVWLLAEACKAAGLSNGPLLDLYRTLCHYALRYGFDRTGGGFYDSGFFNVKADRRDKIWWVQAEALVGALYLYHLTGEKLYWECFSQTLDWIIQHQVDWEYGEWHNRISVTGKISGEKAGAWKSPYHNGRAILQCLVLLSSPLFPDHR